MRSLLYTTVLALYLSVNKVSPETVTTAKSSLFYTTVLAFHLSVKKVLLDTVALSIC